MYSNKEYKYTAAWCGLYICSIRHSIEMALHSMVLHPHSWVGEDRLINELCCIAPLPSWAGHDSFTLHLSDIAKSKRSLLKHPPSAAEQGKAHMISLIGLMSGCVNKHKVIKSMQCFLCKHNALCIIRDQNLLSFCLWGPGCTPALESNQCSYPWIKKFHSPPKPYWYKIEFCL